MMVVNLQRQYLCGKRKQLWLPTSENFFVKKWENCQPLRISLWKNEKITNLWKPTWSGADPSGEVCVSPPSWITSSSFFQFFQNFFFIFFRNFGVSPPSCITSSILAWAGFIMFYFLKLYLDQTTSRLACTPSVLYFVFHLV